MAGVIFISIIVTLLVVGSIWGTLNLDGFYFGMLGSGLVYLGLFGVWFAFWRLGKKRKMQDLAHYAVKRPRISDTYLTIILGFVCIATFLLLQNAVIEIFGLMGYSAPESNIILDGWHRFLIALIVVAVLPSVIEELLFRGLILHSLLPFGRWTAIILSSAMFSLFHLSPAQTVYQFIFGVVLALVYLRTRNMFVPMLLHFVNNATIITILFFGGDWADGGYVNFGAMAIVSTFVLALAGTFVILKLIDAFGNRNSGEVTRRKFDIPELLTLGLGLAIAITIWVFNFLG